MDYMKHSPETCHDDYDDTMQGLWPEDSRKRCHSTTTTITTTTTTTTTTPLIIILILNSNRLYTYDGCATIRELGRVISPSLNIILIKLIILYINYLLSRDNIPLYVKPFAYQTFRW
jgi:hypothetical protein